MPRNSRGADGIQEKERDDDSANRGNIGTPAVSCNTPVYAGEYRYNSLEESVEVTHVGQVRFEMMEQCFHWKKWLAL